MPEDGLSNTAVAARLRWTPRFADWTSCTRGAIACRRSPVPSGCSAIRPSRTGSMSRFPSPTLASTPTGSPHGRSTR